MLNKKKSFWQDNKFIIISMLATMGTMLIVFACNNMVPFGDKTILRMDLYHQYGPLFAELYERVMNGDSLIYSWASGLGSCFLGNYFNYLSSPIGAVIFFFGHNNIPEAIAVMVLLKAALSSATFTWYSKHSLKNQSYATCAFSVLYAFCAYMIAYNWNVMWIDAMVLLPVILLGIERIINNGKPATYITGLALSMFSNYYMSYMLCLFSVVYFLHYYFKCYSFDSRVEDGFKGKGGRLMNLRFLRSGFIFALGSLCAAGLMACVLLPVYNVLQSSSATSGSFPDEMESYFTFFDFFANHLGSLTTTIRSSGDDVLPNVYCGVITIILAPLFFFSKSISKKEKAHTIGLLATLYFTFNLNFINYIWHGFHFPNDLPYRQSFIYSFVLLIIAYKAFLRIGEFTSRQIGVVGAALIAFVFLAEEITSKNVNVATVLLTLILVILYVVVLTIFKDKKYQTASVALMLIVCVCCEVVMCDTAAINISVDKTPYTSDLEAFEEVKESLDTIEQDGFYRMELTDLRTRMDPSWYYYNGVSVFSSMASEKLSNLQDDLGMMSNRINSYTYNPQTPIYNMMFSLKYLVNNESTNVLANSPYYESVVGNDTFEAFRNNYYLPIAYGVNSAVAEWGSEDYMTSWRSMFGGDPFALQGDYFALATGLDNPFERVEVSYITYSNIAPFSEGLNSKTFSYSKNNTGAEGSSVFYFTTEKEGNLYIYFEDSNGSTSKELTFNSSLGTSTHSADQNCILDLGHYAANETVTVTVPYDSDSGIFTLYAYTLNDEIFEKGYNQLKDNQMLVETFEDTYIKGKFTPTEDCLLYTSIPYNKGWSVYIDGEKVSDEDIVAIGDALLAVNVTKGIHEIEFKYTAPGLSEGIALTFMTIGLIALYFLAVSIRKKRSKKVRPAYAPIDNFFSTDIFYEEKKPIEIPTVSEIRHIEYVDIFSDSGIKREVIVPEVRLKREIITPPEEE